MGKVTARFDYEVTGDPESALRLAAEKAFLAVTAELTARFDAAISGEHWRWANAHGGLTPRFGASQMSLRQKSYSYYKALGYEGNKNRRAKAPQAIAGAPRSIVDSGDLKQSRRFTMNKAALKANWTWGVDYAAAVYFGATIHPWNNRNSLATMPGRPWIRAVLQGGQSVGAFGIEQYKVNERMKAYIVKFTSPLG